MKIYRSGDEPEIERLKRDVSTRLNKVCAEWSEDDKEALVLKIVQNELMFPSGRVMADTVLEESFARFSRTTGKGTASGPDESIRG